MKLKLHYFWNFIKAHKVWSGVIVLVFILVFWMFLSKDSNDLKDNFAVVEIGNVQEEVSLTGNVKPLAEVDLAFERGGRIAYINVSVGDKVYAGQTLASVSNADLLANLQQAQANLKKVQAGLGDSVDKSNLEKVQTEMDLENAIKDSYTKADDALRNKIFSLFNDPLRYNSNLIFITDSSLEEDIEDGKREAVETLESWQRMLNKTDIALDLDSKYESAKSNLELIKNLLDKCALAVNGLTTDSNTTKTQIETWKTSISTARTSVNLAIDSLTTYFNQYKLADLSLQISANDTLAEEASIEAARAAIAIAQAELDKTIIRSPITGVITNIPVELGEIVPANQKAVSVISYGQFQIEAFVPEADIAKVKLGDVAKVTLDAYGDMVIWESKVIKIDPAATIIDGVPTYKIILQIVKQDERVRSGMTANLDILTARREGVLIIPARAVYSKNNKRFVRVLENDSKSEREIEVGLRGVNGQVEVLSGLSKGEKVSTSI